MKKFISVIIALFCVGIIACKKSDSTPPSAPNSNNPTPTYAFSATINGGAWSVPSNTYSATFTNNASGHYLNIQGNSPTTTVLLSLFCGAASKPNVIVGNYALYAGFQGPPAVSSVYLYISNTTYSDLVTGNLYVTSIDTAAKNISGTFNFNSTTGPGGQQGVVSNGVFTNVHYTNNF
jgi:Family of unknown function (DUF6252)